MVRENTIKTAARTCAGIAAVTATFLSGVSAAQDAARGANDAVIAPKVSESLLLDAVSTGALMVAVGERGHILVSRDGGNVWAQSRVPTRVTLTGVYFHDENLGWAVGHDAVILRTADGGESWEIVYSSPEEQRPLFDVWFRDSQNGFAIGAYGYYLVTSDGGDTWSDTLFSAQDLVVEETGESAEESWDDMDEGGDYHLNAIAVAGNGKLYIAAEAGQAYRSDDGGQTWLRLASPYQGSFFGALPLAGDSFLMFGLRGHLFRSNDGGVNWSEVDTGTVALLTNAVKLDNGDIALAGLGGTVLVSGDNGGTFELFQQEDRKGVSAVLVADNGDLILVGENGIKNLPRSALAN